MSVVDFLWRFPSVQMAWRNLGRNRLRTMLAAPGIIIGVVSICSLGMATAVIQQQATSQLGGIGNKVSITSGQDSDTDRVTDNRVDTIRNLVTDAEVVPQKTNSTTISSRNGREMRISITEVTNAAALYSLTSGEAPSRLLSGALLSNSTATTLGIEEGNLVEYDGRLYRVQGLIEEENTFGFGGGELVLPESGLSDQNYYNTVTVVAENNTTTIEIGGELDQYFNTEDKEELSINTSRNAGQVGGFLETLSLALLAISGISLVIAGVAILNVILMNTVERRGEVGILHAVGIRRSEVLRMILTEAALMGTFDGLVGATLSPAAGLVIFQMITGGPLGTPQWSNAQHLVYGFGFAVVASVFSGIYPAWKAANDRLADALRG